jgi:gliding motility-associated transport system permease protein
MSNIVAIAQKELKSYFASPIAYIVIGVFALLYGFFYFIMLQYFMRVSLQAMAGGGQSVNINEMMLRPMLQNVTVIVLFVLPMVTMRTYSEEKRSGTIELLLTSPLTDFQIIVGKFLGALALYATMLAVTLIHIAILFIYGSPEWKPLVTAYAGLLLLGSCFIAMGLFVSSLTKNQVVAGVVTFGLALFLWVISWLSSFSTGTIGTLATYLSLIDHFDDFSKGVIDTTHLAYYLSFITFALFLTAKSVDSERWRG